MISSVSHWGTLRCPLRSLTHKSSLQWLLFLCVSLMLQIISGCRAYQGNALFLPLTLFFLSSAALSWLWVWQTYITTQERQTFILTFIGSVIILLFFLIFLMQKFFEMRKMSTWAPSACSPVSWTPFGMASEWGGSCSCKATGEEAASLTFSIALSINLAKNKK